jgi:hypothetical protein
MSGAENDVHRIGVALEDRRQRVDDVLDPFVRRQEPEREEHPLALDPEPVLAVAGERDIRDAVRNEVDLVVRHTVHLVEQLGALRAHDDEAFREGGQLLHGVALQEIGRAEDGVERSHDGHAQLAQQHEHMASRLAAEYPVLVLHVHEIDHVHIQEVGCTPV